MTSISSVRFRLPIVGTVICLMIVPQSLPAYCIDHVEEIQADPQLVAFLPDRGDFALPKLDKEKFRRELAQRKIGALTKLMEKEGKSTKRLLERAKLHLELEQDQKAVEDYDEIIKLEPKSVEHREARLVLNQEQYRYDAVETDLSALIELDPSLKRYLARANFYYDRWKTKEAIRDFTKVIELDGNIAEAYARRGHLLAATKKEYVRISDEAISDLKKAIELDGNQILAHRDLIVVYLNAGKYQSAVKHATEIIERKTDDPCARFRRARAYRRLAKYEEALQDLDILLGGAPGSSMYIVERAEIYKEMKEVDKAIQEYELAIEVDPSNSSTYGFLARFLLSNKRYDKAILNYQKALELDTLSTAVQGEFYAELANAEYWVGNLEESAKHFGKAAELKPSAAMSYLLQKGDVLGQMKKFDEALALYESMIDPKNMTMAVYERRARVYLVQGELDKAMADMNEFLRTMKDNAEGYQLRAKIWKRLGNEEKAAEDLKNAEEAAARTTERRAKAKAHFDALRKKIQEEDSANN
ncbi:tetratricopeptide repeat protein [Blastopirellula marina]|nr:tetratricopeptide repeat protein [Blastopirellula marina]